MKPRCHKMQYVKKLHLNTLKSMQQVMKYEIIHNGKQLILCTPTKIKYMRIFILLFMTDSCIRNRQPPTHSVCRTKTPTRHISLTAIAICYILVISLKNGLLPSQYGGKIKTLCLTAIKRIVQHDNKSRIRGLQRSDPFIWSTISTFAHKEQQMMLLVNSNRVPCSKF